MVSSKQIIRQGDIWWADLPEPAGAGPGFRRPILVVQRNSINQSRIQTIVCVILTSNLRLASVPGNVLLAPEDTGLPKESVANVSQLITVDKRMFDEYVGPIPDDLLEKVLNGIEYILGR